MSRIVWRDRHGDLWAEGLDGLLHARETAPFTRERVTKKWGPLVEVTGPGAATIDHVPVRPGMAVWNYDLRPDVVDSPDHVAQDGTLWWRTRLGVFDGKRLWLHHPTTGARATAEQATP